MYSIDFTTSVVLKCKDPSVLFWEHLLAVYRQQRLKTGGTEVAVLGLHQRSHQTVPLSREVYLRR